VHITLTFYYIKMETVQGNNYGGNVGSYAISTVGFESWMNENLSQNNAKSKKFRSKEVVNKIFLDCAAVINDPFWIEKFNQAAFGKMPRKFTFRDSSLSYKKGTKYFSIDIPSNPYEASTLCVEFFRSNGGIFSPMDKQNSLELQYMRSQEVLTKEQLTWGTANKKTQECMISYYVSDMKNIMELNRAEYDQLKQIINFGISNKYFDKNSILVDSNRIYSMTGLLWNSEKRVFYINPDIKPATVRTYARKKEGSNNRDRRQKDMVPQFSIKWKKYIETLEKEIMKNLNRQRKVSIEDSSTNYSAASTVEFTSKDDDDNDDTEE